MVNFGWSLPPGVTQSMIDDAAGSDPNFELEDDRECDCGFNGKVTISQWVEWEDDPDEKGRQERVVYDESWECPHCEKQHDLNKR